MRIFFRFVPDSVAPSRNEGQSGSHEKQCYHDAGQVIWPSDGLSVKAAGLASMHGCHAAPIHGVRAQCLASNECDEREPWWTGLLPQSLAAEMSDH